MQTISALWETLFSSPHKTEYRFDINGVTYSKNDIKGAPVIVKPLMDTPAIGRVCTGSLKFTVYPKEEIPKAAAVNAYCRLVSADGSSVSEWLSQGQYFITSRTGKDTITLSCLDLMIKAGTTYRDKSKFTEWPMPMANVVNEICEIMDVQLDSRTVVNAGDAFMVDYPNDDVLISEILGMIGAAHGGNWIFTEQGKLRLILFSSPQSPVQDLGKTHKGFTAKGKKQILSRIILTDSADNDFTAGDDTGFTISAKCDYATQEIVNLLCASDSSLYGSSYEPYSVDCAYLNPAIELGDTISVKEKDGTIHDVVVQGVTMNCTVACTCSLIASVEDETEDEYPYISMQDLAISRTLKTNQSYFGNRITRSEGFVSELLVNGKATARLTANAALFSMQSTDANGNWIDRIYFDTKTGKYVISTDVTIQGAVTVESLSDGTTTINGACIKTGTISASYISGGILDCSLMTVKNLNASSITTGALSADRLSGGTLDCSKITVKSLDASSITTGALSADRLSGGTIDASKITVKNLNASNITSGTISADRIDTSSLKVNTVYTTDLNKVAMKSVGTSTLYLAGDSTWNFDNTFIYGEKSIRFGRFGTWSSNHLVFDTQNLAVYPSDATWGLGTISCPFSDIWCNNIQLRNGSSTVAHFGFNGGTFECVFSGAAVNQLGSSTYYWGTGYITKLYLGSSCYLSASGSSLCINGTAISSGSDFAGQEVKMGGSTSYYIVCNTSRELRPYSTSTTYPCYLGTSSYYWHYAYIGSNTVKIGSTASSKLAFFAGTPIARQTLSTTSNNMNYTSATASNYLYILNNLVGILKNKYGLIA